MVKRVCEQVHMNLKCRGGGYFVMAGKSAKRWYHDFNGNPYCSSWPGLVPAIHVFFWRVMKDVDARDIGAKQASSPRAGMTTPLMR